MDEEGKYHPHWQKIIDEGVKSREVKWTPIYPIERKVAESENGYIFISSEGDESLQIDEFDLFINQKDHLLTYCGPSQESILSGSKGQDSISITSIEENYNNLLLLAEADGVGISYKAEIAARESAKFIAEHGGTSLEENLKSIVNHLKRIELPKPNTPNQLLNEVLEEKRSEGSNTTINQLLIDKDSGKVEGLFHGDGYVVIVRKTGEVEKHLCGNGTSAPSQVSTKSGLLGSTEKFNDQLNQGDVIIFYSDGLDKLEDSVLGKIASIIGDSENYEQSSREIWELVSSQELRDDDRSLLIYTHK